MKLDLTVYPAEEVERVFQWAMLVRDLLTITDCREQLVGSIKGLALEANHSYAAGIEGFSDAICAAVTATLAYDDEIEDETASAFVVLTIILLYKGADGVNLTAESLIRCITTMDDDISKGDV